MEVDGDEMRRVAKLVREIGTATDGGRKGSHPAIENGGSGIEGFSTQGTLKDVVAKLGAQVGRLAERTVNTATAITASATNHDATDANNAANVRRLHPGVE